MNLSIFGTALRLPVAILLAVGGALLVGSPPSRAQETATAQTLPATATATAEPIAQGQRVFSVGHSFHVFMPAILRDMAQAAEIKDHVQVGLSSIGGSRVIQHWNVPDDKFKAKASLRSGKVDVLTLAPIYLPDDGIENFVNLALEHNPDIRITVQEFWLPFDLYEPGRKTGGKRGLVQLIRILGDVAERVELGGLTGRAVCWCGDPMFAHSTYTPN